MATKVVMEALSPTMEEGRLVEWKKQEGDVVKAGDVLAEVETDKAVMELVARAGGTLLRHAVVAGTTVPVSQLVGWIGQPGEALGDSAATPPAPAAPGAVSPAGAPATKQAATPAPAAPVALGRVKASPLARKMAADRGVDLSRVPGSGPEGRVIRRDVEGAGATPAAAPAPERAAGPAFTDVPLSMIRKTIAKRLAQSIGPIPTFYLTTEIDMERAADFREQFKTLYGDTVRISFNDLVVRAAALALVQHPACNAWWQDDKIRYWKEVHIGMAVAVEDGLITPVIRNADLKPLREIGAESRDLAGRARDRKLTPDQYTGSTFSISNLGMFDIEHFTAVINPPEAAILAVGSIAQVAAVVGGQVVPRRRMRVTLSCDHRVIDGATGAQFLKTLKQLMENPVGLQS